MRRFSNPASGLRSAAPRGRSTPVGMTCFAPPLIWKLSSTPADAEPLEELQLQIVRAGGQRNGVELPLRVQRPALLVLEDGQPVVVHHQPAVDVEPGPLVASQEEAVVGVRGHQELTGPAHREVVVQIAESAEIRGPRLEAHLRIDATVRDGAVAKIGNGEGLRTDGVILADQPVAALRAEARAVYAQERERRSLPLGEDLAPQPPGA